MLGTLVALLLLASMLHWILPLGSSAHVFGRTVPTFALLLFHAGGFYLVGYLAGHARTRRRERLFLK